MSLLLRSRAALARMALRTPMRTLTTLAAASHGRSNDASSAARFPWQRVITGAVAFTALATGIRSASNAAASTSDAAASSSSSSSSSASAPLTPTGKLKVGLVQLRVETDKAANISAAVAAVSSAASQGARLVVLPEMWNCPYSNSSFGPYSEQLPEVGTSLATIQKQFGSSPSLRAMASLARDKGLWLVAGSIPEKAPLGRGEAPHPKSGLDFHLYNTALVFSPEGQLVAKHRKAHLFDIDVPGRVTFRESDTLSAGKDATTFSTPFGTVGLGICYDIRFPELAALMSARGARMLIYPGAFNTTTGPLHWELLSRARAVDNQAWVITCSPARAADPKAPYQAWGHSSMLSPWGRVAATTGHEPDLVIAEIDLAETDEIRRMIPVATQKRKDIYKLAQGP